MDDIIQSVQHMRKSIFTQTFNWFIWYVYTTWHCSLLYIL